MDKILADYRKMVGDFEVLEYLDEKTAQRLRDEVDVDVPVDLHWTWNYASEIQELRRLYEKGKAGQWDAQTDLDCRFLFPRTSGILRWKSRCWPTW